MKGNRIGVSLGWNGISKGDIQEERKRVIKTEQLLKTITSVLRAKGLYVSDLTVKKVLTPTMESENEEYASKRNLNRQINQKDQNIGGNEEYASKRNLYKSNSNLKGKYSNITTGRNNQPVALWPRADVSAMRKSKLTGRDYFKRKNRPKFFNTDLKRNRATINKAVETRLNIMASKLYNNNNNGTLQRLVNETRQPSFSNILQLDRTPLQKIKVSGFVVCPMVDLKGSASVLHQLGWLIKWLKWEVLREGNNPLEIKPNLDESRNVLAKSKIPLRYAPNYREIAINKLMKFTRKSLAIMRSNLNKKLGRGNNQLGRVNNRKILMSESQGLLKRYLVWVAKSRGMLETLNKGRVRPIQSIFKPWLRGKSLLADKTAVGRANKMVGPMVRNARLMGEAYDIEDMLKEVGLLVERLYGYKIVWNVHTSLRFTHHAATMKQWVEPQVKRSRWIDIFGEGIIEKIDHNSLVMDIYQTMNYAYGRTRNKKPHKKK